MFVVGQILLLIALLLLFLGALLVPWLVGRASKIRELEHIPDSRRAMLARLRRQKLIPAAIGRGLWALEWTLLGMGAALLFVGRDRVGIYMIVGAQLFRSWMDLIGHLIGRRWVRTFMDRAVQEDYRICTECLYSLRGHGDSGRCPECGTDFNHAELVQAWQDVKHAHYSLV